MLVHQKHKKPLFKISLPLNKLTLHKGLVWFLLVSNLVLFILLIVFGKAKLLQTLTATKQKVHSKISTSYHRWRYPNPDSLAIDIGFEEWQQILQKREEALELGLLMTSDEDFVEAEVTYEGEKIPVKLRLKGDWTDHLESNKWSFRIHIKGDNSFKGMKYFSLQDPHTRIMANEWIFYQVLQQQDLIAIRYDFIDVTVNGEHRGVMAIEEHFSKELVENNQRREGPILKFNEDRVWENNLYYDFLANIEKDEPYLSEIQPFKAGKTLRDPVLSQEFYQAERLLREYRKGSLLAEEVFALQDWAKLFALADIFNVRHGLTTHNIRFYYNPVTGLIEPVAFDAMIYKRADKLSIEEESIFSDFPGVLENQDFLTAYFGYLEEFSQTKFLDDLLLSVDDDLDRIENWLNRDELYKFDPKFFYLNQEFLRRKLTNEPLMRASLNQQGQLEMYSLTKVPVEVLEVRDPDGGLMRSWRTPSQSYFLPVAPKGKVPTIVKAQLFSDKELQELLQYRYEDLEKYAVVYKVPGTDKEYKTNLTRWILNLEDLRHSFSTQLPSFVKWDAINNQYFIPAGSWQVEEDIIVPTGFSLRVEPGASLDLIEGAKIIVRGPVKMVGEVDAPIKVYSSDKTGQGLLVLDAEEFSTLSYVEFSDLSNIHDKGVNVTGSVSFYESPVKITHVVFKDNHSEDMLNIIRSEFEIDGSSFVNAFSDALDVDFGVGKITNSNFKNSTNDSLDVSGSQIEAEGLKIINAGDKGVSAGEASEVKITESKIQGSNIAYASKDSSELTVYLGEVINNTIGFATYQKKPEYGPATLIIWNTLSSGQKRKWLIEKDSMIIYNGNDYFQDEKNVYQRLIDNADSFITN